MALAVKITVLTENFAPFQIVTPTSIEGLSTEIISATLKESELKYTIEAYPWSLSYNRAKEQVNTCIYSIARSPQREMLFQWIGHITTDKISLYSLATNNRIITSLEDAKQYKTAVIKDDVVHQYFLSEGFIENENLYALSNYDMLLEFLEAPSRQIDFIVTNEYIIKNMSKSQGAIAKYTEALTLNGVSLSLYFACSLKTDSKVINKLSQAMKTLESKGVFNEIRKQWQAK